MSALHPGDRVELRCDGADRLGVIIGIRGDAYAVDVAGRRTVFRHRNELHLASEPRPPATPHVHDVRITVSPALRIVAIECADSCCDGVTPDEVGEHIRAARDHLIAITARPKEVG